MAENVELMIVDVAADDVKLNALAAHHPDGYDGLTVDYADVPAGHASTVAYLAAANEIVSHWMGAFHNTAVMLMHSNAFPSSNPYGQATGNTVAALIEWLGGGYMTNGMYAICQQDYGTQTGTTSHVKGNQAIYALSNSSCYQGSACANGGAIPPFGAQRVNDLIENAYEKMDCFIEPYYQDMHTTDTAMQAAWAAGYPKLQASSAELFNSPSALNISTRLNILTGDNVLIGGFIVTGTTPKNVIIRGIGPSLAVLGLTGVLADPVLELHEPDGTVLINDNWKESQQTAIEETGIAPTNTLESALVETLAPGAYTAVLYGQNGGTGVGLLEVYDLDPGLGSQLANISSRCLVGTIDDVMIGGFILGATDGSANVVVRALGPSLVEQGVNGPLADPTLELHDANGSEIAFDDDWSDDPAQAAEIAAVGLTPTNAKESALAATLPPGNYTAIVAGKEGSTGVSLVEIYRLP
jgi:hypothetical protein